MQCAFEGKVVSLTMLDIVMGIFNLSVLLTWHLQAICSLLRTPIASIDNLSVKLPDPDASKVQWALECYSGKVLSHISCVLPILWTY